MWNLRNLPPGAIYVDKQGQATLQVQYVRDTIYIDSVKQIKEYVYIIGTCDSLQRQVEFYQSELIRIRGQTTVTDTLSRTEQTQSAPAITFYGAFKWCSIGILIGVLTTITILILRKKWKHK